MPDDYDKLKNELFEKLSETEETVRVAERADVELPPPVTNELRYAGYHYIKADKKFSEGSKEEAVKEMQKAVNHVRRAFFDVLEFRFLVCLKTARSVVEEFKGYEDLAYKCIPNYGEHAKNLREIGSIAENAKLPGNDSPEYLAICEDRIKKLQTFLNDFDVGERALFAAINKEKNAYALKKRYIVISISATIAAAILGCAIGLFITLAFDKAM